VKQFASRMARRYGRSSNIGEIIGRLLQWGHGTHRRAGRAFRCGTIVPD
jgi:hypothetical protein